MEIQPVKLVRGQDLTCTMVETEPELIFQQYHLEDVSPDEWYDKHSILSTKKNVHHIYKEYKSEP